MYIICRPILSTGLASPYVHLSLLICLPLSILMNMNRPYQRKRKGSYDLPWTTLCVAGTVAELLLRGSCNKGMSANHQFAVLMRYGGVDQATIFPTSISDLFPLFSRFHVSSLLSPSGSPT